MSSITSSVNSYFCLVYTSGKIYCYFGRIWGGQLQWYKDNKALKDEHLPEGKENPNTTEVAVNLAIIILEHTRVDAV